GNELGLQLMVLADHRRDLVSKVVVVTASAIQTIPANHVETRRGNVLQVAAEGLARGEGHHLLLTQAIVLVTEAHPRAVECHEPALPEGTTMQIAAEIVEDRGGVAVTLPDMHVPPFVSQLQPETFNVHHAPPVWQPQASLSRQLASAF